MNKAKRMSYITNAREDFIAAIAICAIILGEGQLFAPVEKGANL